MSTRTLTPKGQEGVRADKVIELRTLLAEKFPDAGTACHEHPRLATGIGILDDVLGGGLPKAALTEVVRPPLGVGSATLVRALVKAAHAARRPLALVDASNSFDQDGLTKEQLALLLWVRCIDLEKAVHAADLLLRDGNLPLVVLDLVMCGERQVRGIPGSSWHRLQRIAGERGTSALVLTPVPIFAGVRHTLRLTGRLGLPAIDLLHDDVTASLRMETVRTRFQPYTVSTFGHTAHELSA